MVNLFLKHRETQAKEIMDNPDCDKTLLFNTYEQFIQINKIFAGWKQIYHRYMLPYFKSNNGQGSILDIGCGGGDVLLFLDTLAKKDGISLELQGIDPDASALEFIKIKQFPQNISFKQCWLKDIKSCGKQYDFVISNNVIHHLTPDEFANIRQDAELIAKKMIIFNDLCRSDLAWLFFKVFATLLYRHSFAAYDGCLSIKRSYTRLELLRILPKDWQVIIKFPYRNLIIKEK
jgi:2-polyprenyl-3-methyl-5-hydroxy-6-metoxy-1,4-benzoquinol methylase